MTRWNTGHFPGSGTTLREATPVAVYYYTCAKNCKMHTKSKPSCNPWTLGDNDESM